MSSDFDTTRDSTPPALILYKQPSMCLTQRSSLNNAQHPPSLGERRDLGDTPLTPRDELPWRKWRQAKNKVCGLRAKN